ncbi:polysaccharide pyruvyl transferase family protein [Myroides guanonis]|uniref:Polysaccharide pyruvyl transferase family protein WcaK n=1 Tax=Myroides guanonis TaxID=1150112 RepID=A0A1I3L3R5_9FLAO|nr:polysaccharide pyruvyl transferase family protein [Myroides guanonis]SFI79373.1 Polysaccharide pyruvyl transferase family protein WcaK [Myroides guanonis]
MCKKILIINQGYIRNNLGDQAIRVALNKYFKEKYYEIEWSFLTKPSSIKEALPKENYIVNERVETQKRVTNILFVVAGIIKWILLNISHIKRKCKNEYDYVIIGGGQLFNSSNSYYPHSFSYSIFLWTFFSKKYKNKIIFLGIGCNNKFNFLERYFYKKSLNKASKVICRDIYSSRALLNDFNIISEILPDVAFYDYELIDSTKTVKEFFSLSIYCYSEFDSNFNKEKINKEEYYYKWIKILQNELKEDEEIHLFSTTSTDYNENICFLEHLKEKGLFNDRKIVVHDITDLEKLSKLFQRSRKVLSARMHALLIAYKSHSELLVFEISDKLKTFNKEYISSSASPGLFKQKIKKQLDIYF